MLEYRVEIKAGPSGLGSLQIYGRRFLFCKHLACIIHEFFGIANKCPQQRENLCCGFRQMLHTRSWLTLSKAEGP